MSVTGDRSRMTKRSFRPLDLATSSARSSYFSRASCSRKHQQTVLQRYGTVLQRYGTAMLWYGTVLQRYCNGIVLQRYCPSVCPRHVSCPRPWRYADIHAKVTLVWTHTCSQMHQHVRERHRWAQEHGRMERQRTN